MLYVCTCLTCVTSFSGLEYLWMIITGVLLSTKTNKWKMENTNKVILEPEKRKRGRPKKVVNDEGNTTTTETVPPKKLGRPRTSHSVPCTLVESDVETNNASVTEVSSKSRSQSCSRPQRNSVWNRIVGSADWQCIPSQCLPTNRVVLQRFCTISDARPRDHLQLMKWQLNCILRFYPYGRRWISQPWTRKRVSLVLSAYCLLGKAIVVENWWRIVKR